MSFSAIDLSKLPAPQIIEQPDFEAIFAARKARLIELAEAAGDADYLASLAVALELESEPLVQLLQEDSYRELLLRAAVQDAGKGLLLAFAEGATLDHIAAQYGVERQIVQAADPDATPSVAEILESDDQLRKRVQLSLEAYSTAGPRGAYIYWALTADVDVKNVSVQTPAPTEVVVTVLSHIGNGAAPQTLLDAVTAVLSDETIRPLADQVTVQGATISTYDVVASLTLYPGPDEAVVLDAVEAAVAAYVDGLHRLGHDIARSGLFAALHQPGVQAVTLTEPATDLVMDPSEAAYCSSISVAVGGRDV